MKFVAMISGMMLCAFSLQAQDTLNLKVFEVRDSLPVSIVSSYHWSTDSLSSPKAMRVNNLTQLLNQGAGISFKDYGPGMLSTPTFRGGDANHTQVMWNGMLLNSPMLGVLDFSTIPISQFTSISLMSGVSSGLFTSGGMGSLIALEQQVNFNERTALLSTAIASFGDYATSGRLNLPIQNKHFPLALGISLDYHESENKFPYKDIFQIPYTHEVMDRAAYRRSNHSISLLAMPAKSTQAELIFWYGNTLRSIPSPINTKKSHAIQSDEAYRGMVTLEHYVDSAFSIGWKSMVEHNGNRFTDSTSAVNTNNVYTFYQNKLEAIYRFNRRSNLHVSFAYNHIVARSEFYEHEISVSQYSLVSFFRSQLIKRRLHLDAGIRAESNMAYERILPMAGLSYRAFNKLPLEFIASASQTTRFPTLNDLYWNPGGNKELLPEDGYVIESGIQWFSKKIRIKGMMYYSEYRNRIRWLPSGSVFSSQNIDHAEVAGSDLHLDYTQTLRKHRINLFVNHHYTIATGANQGETMYALSYVPAHSASVGLDYHTKALGFHYRFNHTGKRFVSNDESIYMPAYQVSSAGCSYKLPIRNNQDLQMSLWISNIADRNYQNMPWRPMPGRSFQFKIDWIWEG